MKAAPLALGVMLASCRAPHAETRAASWPSRVEPSRGDVTTRTPSDAETREALLIAAMVARVSRARGIAAPARVPGVVLTRAALIAQVREHVAREIPIEAIRSEALEMKLLGFVPTALDYEEAEFSLLEAQLSGYYEPADKTMYLAADLPEKEARATLAHELVHALQDTRWDLLKRSAYHPGESDHALANAALHEGDATSAMFDVGLADEHPGHSAVEINDDSFAAKMREGIAEGPGAELPEIMRTSLAAPYLYGVLFVHALRRRGGWDEVNRAWDDPPATTEQILHLDKYDAREAALAVEPPAFASLGAGWSAVDSDTFGELGARLYFEQWMDVRTARHAAAGWGGDRGSLLRRGDDAGLAWRLRYDVGSAAPDELSKRAFYALSSALEQRFGPAASKVPATFVCIERKELGPLAIARSVRDLVFVAGPTHAVGEHWANAGSCAGAKTWAEEILARP